MILIFSNNFLILITEFIFQGLILCGDRISPVKHLRLENDLNRNEQKIVLQEIVEKSRNQGVGLTQAVYLEESEVFLPKPSIRVTCSILLEDEDIIKSGKIIKGICDRMF